MWKNIIIGILGFPIIIYISEFLEDALFMFPAEFFAIIIGGIFYFIIFLNLVALYIKQKERPKEKKVNFYNLD